MQPEGITLLLQIQVSTLEHLVSFLGVCGGFGAQGSSSFFCGVWMSGGLGMV